jgi:hypothetical protein
VNKLGAEGVVKLFEVFGRALVDDPSLVERQDDIGDKKTSGRSWLINMAEKLYFC